jgi:hypothetical protein
MRDHASTHRFAIRAFSFLNLQEMPRKPDLYAFLVD